MQGNISYIALLPGQYLDIGREGNIQILLGNVTFSYLLIHPLIQPFISRAIETSILYIVGLVTCTCGIEFLSF